MNLGRTVNVPMKHGSIHSAWAAVKESLRDRKDCLLRVQQAPKSKENKESIKFYEERITELESALAALRKGIHA